MDVRERFERSGEAATKLARELSRAGHFGALGKIIARTELPASLVATAQALVDGVKPKGLVDFQIVYGLALLLAKEGSKKSWAVVERFADRAIRAAKHEAVVNPAELLARYLPKSKLRDRLAAIERERTNATESRAIGLPDGAWSVWIGVGVPNVWFGAMQKGPQIHLAVDPADKPDWKLQLQGETDGIYANWGGKVTQDDFRLPKLARLADFPAWVPSAAKKLRVAFSIDDAIVKAGRNRRAIEPIRTWLRG